MQPTSCRVAHVTEAMGGGIVTVIASIARRQVEQGATVEVHYLRRPETPSTGDLQALFPASTRLVEYSSGSRVRSLLKLMEATRRLLVRGEADYVHAHSSIAGALARLAVPVGKPARRVFYSPHGWAFLRLDLPAWARRSFILAEKLLARGRSTVVLTCPSEFEYGVRQLDPRRAALIQTGVDPAALAAPAPAQPSGRRLRVGTVARICYQKAPWRFADVARQLSAEADFRWIGGGAAEDRDRWIGDAPVDVTGWLSPDQLARELSEVDVFLFPTLWEGMPMALMQAQALGIPSVVSDAVGNRDAVRDAATGYVCEEEDELVRRTCELLRDPVLRRRMSETAREWARTALTDENVGRQTLDIYAEAGA
ncbi:glycosyltransferase family 4 protein [Zhihengliuella sp.]|uniref:glycosyltransferase family 4 protein n=1 Tax=Zhihengliuella sp. TaxID=1954483 RepID=UPI00281184D1|nr:glycosyltransferase family 4 protein [Zhihengliuella sp.]